MTQHQQSTKGIQCNIVTSTSCVFNRPFRSKFQLCGRKSFRKSFTRFENLSLMSPPSRKICRILKKFGFNIFLQAAMMCLQDML